MANALIDMDQIRITVLISAIAHFTSIYMGLSLKLKIMVQEIFILSKRFFGVPLTMRWLMESLNYSAIQKRECVVVVAELARSTKLFNYLYSWINFEETPVILQVLRLSSQKKSKREVTTEIDGQASVFQCRRLIGFVLPYIDQSQIIPDIKGNNLKYFYSTPKI
jgi:hypothetical protein